MVKIKNIKDKPCSLYYKDEFICIVDNLLDFLDIRVQIKKEYEGKEYEWTPYYFLFEGERIYVDSDGRINEWTDGFFDTFQNLLIQLV